MIIETLLNAIFAVILFVIGLIPDMAFQTMNFGSGFLTILSYGIYIIGAATFSLVIANVIWWKTVQFGWSSIEWLYKKLPGID